MDKDRMSSIVNNMNEAKVEVIRCQREIAEELTMDDNILDAIMIGLVRPCIPMDILNNVMKRRR